MGSIAYGTLDVNAWVAVHDGCEISCKPHPGSGVSVTVTGTNRRRGPGGDEEFEFWFETGALRMFLALGTDALAELDSAAGDSAADQSVPEPAPVGGGRDSARSARGLG